MRSIRTRAIALTAALVLLTLALSAGSVLADGGRHHGEAPDRLGLT
jgi:hypothetical protein